MNKTHIAYVEIVNTGDQGTAILLVGGIVLLLLAWAFVSRFG